MNFALTSLPANGCSGNRERRSTALLLPILDTYETTTTTTNAADTGKRTCTVGLESSLALVVLPSPLGASPPLSPTMLPTDGVVEHELLGS